MNQISIHAPARGATKLSTNNLPASLYFNPRPPRGGRQLCTKTTSIVSSFQSTPPARGATSWRQTARNLSIFQSTPPARGATRRPGSACQRCRISIHAPREGGDHRICANKRKSRGFQSTPPARGATDGAICRRRSMGNFNPRPPRGGRPGDALHGVQPAVISIHAPREGGDTPGHRHQR